MFPGADWRAEDGSAQSWSSSSPAPHLWGHKEYFQDQKNDRLFIQCYHHVSKGKGPGGPRCTEKYLYAKCEQTQIRVQQKPWFEQRYLCSTETPGLQHTGLSDITLLEWSLEDICKIVISISARSDRVSFTFWILGSWGEGKECAGPSGRSPGSSRTEALRPAAASMESQVLGIHLVAM